MVYMGVIETKHGRMTYTQRYSERGRTQYGQSSLFTISLFLEAS